MEVLNSAGRKPNVYSLSLEGNLMSPSAVLTLCATIRNPQNRFRSLNLSMCGLGDALANKLIDAVLAQAKPTVRYVNLSCNGITDVGIRHMAQTFFGARSGHSLRHLTLSFNPVTPVGVLELLRCPSVPHLDFRYCMVDIREDGSLQHLIQGMGEARVVQSLYLEGNPCPADAADRITHGIHHHRRSSLLGEAVITGPGVGHLQGVEDFLSESCARRGAPQVGGYPQSLVRDVRQVMGSSLVVRGELRDTNSRSTSAHRSQSRSRSASVRVEGVEVDTSPEERAYFTVNNRRLSAFTSKPTSPSAYSSEGAAEMLCPVVAKLRAKRRAQEDADRKRMERVEREQQLEFAKLNLAMPLDQQQVYHRYGSVSQEASMRSASVRSASMTSLSSPSAAVSPSFPRQIPVLRLLDLAAADDAQCFKILNLPTDPIEAEMILREPTSGVAAMPDALRDFCALPSELGQGEERIGGLAKLMWLIANAPGPRIDLAAMRVMPDVPQSIRLSPPEVLARYRSMRGVENRAAQRLLDGVLNVASSRRPSSRFRPSSLSPIALHR